MKYQRCPNCGGKGWIKEDGIKEKCPVCKGKKIVFTKIKLLPENFKVYIKN